MEAENMDAVILRYSLTGAIAPNGSVRSGDQWLTFRLTDQIRMIAMKRKFYVPRQDAEARVEKECSPML